MPAIEGLRIHAIEMPECERQIRSRCLNQEMIAVVQQDPGMAAHPISVHRRGQRVRKPGAIGIVSDDGFALIAPSRDVIDVPRKGES